MRQSRKFDRILEECLERLLKGETIEQCLESFPEHREVLKPLLETAQATRQALAIQPRSEFREKARYQFHSALQAREAKRAHLFFDWQVRWVAVVAVILALLLAGGGTVAAANGSMPDGTLYPVKLATEQVRLMLTPSSLGKAELYVKLADRRMVEITHMAAKSKPEEIERTAQRLDICLGRMADLAPEVKGGGMMAPMFQGAERGKRLPPRVERRARLKGMMMSQASGHAGRLRALLKTVPPSARPALLRAIAISESGYQKALESLD